jgi:hypothetical protein
MLYVVNAVYKPHEDGVSAWKELTVFFREKGNFLPNFGLNDRHEPTNMNVTNFIARKLREI